MDLSNDQSEFLLNLAKRTIEQALRGDDAPSIETNAPGLLQPAGGFVSLHVRATHSLRGCVGRMDASQPLITCVRDTAMSVLSDPRFTDKPVTLQELPQLEIEISVLSPLMPATDPLDFDLLNDGIYLMIDGRAGVFLPQVARETGWSKEQLLDRLCTEKMGFPARAWRLPGARLMKFSTKILGPVAW
jgi:AmmeMemoRadiSam system protein A